MRKKLFTFLLALVTSVGLSWATVITWDQSKLSSMAMNIESGSGSKASDGIEVTAVSTGEFVRFCYGGAIEIGNGEGSGGGYLTFTSSVGNIAQIDIIHSGAGEWRNANGDWISPYYENFEGGIFRWSGTPAASITLTGDAPRHIDGITSIEFTIEDGGGSSTPATGLQVVEVTSDIYNGWNSNGNTFSVNALPGFQAVTFDEAKAWTEVPTSGTAVLVYRTNGDYARVIHFFDGTISGDYDLETDFNQMYENITLFGNRIFYTAGGSTPTPDPDPTPTPSATGVIFANCYDCWRSPDYPKISGQCYLHSFADPRVGNNKPSGPWKLEFVENYNSSSTEYDSDIVKNAVANEYYKTPAEMEVYRLYQWQNGAYQPVAYGVLYAYANENNQVEHAAFFEADGFWGCYLTDNTHSNGDNINILFNEDASTGFADLHGGSTPANVCGDGLTWELNGGVLTISYDGEGTGEMYDFDYEYESPVNVAPWKEYKSEITTVVIGDGVKSIGNNAFNDLSENFTAVTIANSVERIGLNAFLNSEEITEITLPSSLKTIDEQGFANCGFTSITIPSGVTSIGYKAFCYCRDLTSLTCEATTPPTLASSVFYKVRSNTSSLSSIPLYVPSGSVTAYEAAAQWNDFDIQGYDPAPTPTPSGDGDKLAGAFSVGGDKVVYFSKANLQATTADNGSTWTWGFAEHQYDFIGNAAANNAINGGGTVSANGAVDLFAWSSTANNYFGINNSINEADYSGDFKDWGAKMGSDWRTLTINEWQYLLQDRNPGSSSANYTSYPRYTNAQILTDGTAPQKDIKGIILFPDDFNDGGESIDGVTWGSINPSFFSSYPTTCTTAGWATLESMGCVFLPSAGSRQNFGDEFAILDANLMGNYWSSTLYSGEPEDPQSIAVGGGTLGIGTSPRYWGMSVRLVSETAPSGGSSTPASGSCGDGLTWELSEGVLTISYDGVGTGEMYDFGYEYDENPVNVAPWKEYKSEITTVIVGDGVKSIGNHAFNDLSENFTAVTIANSVERIGVSAFLNSEEITEITLPSSLKTIDEQGFANCGFSSITIPSGVTSIGYKAFCYCRDLTSLTCEATTPPTLASSVFYKVRSNTSSLSSIPLYVPSASVTAYEAAAQWNAFDIQGYDPAPTPSGTTVTWDLSDMASMGTQGGYFKAKGITLMAYGVDNGMSGDGSYGGAFFGGPFVFTTSLGKFTKIEVTNSYLYDQPAFSGDGWTLDGTNAVWEGTPAALVSLVSNFGGITQIKFTIDPNTSTPANSCGDGLTWAVNDGVLTISYDGVGTGSMDNYDDPLSMPWYGQNITSVVLPEGLISIGQNAFAFINTFSQITLPSTLQYILMNAFSGCGLTSVTIPENVKGISASAFISSSSLATVTFEPTTPPRVGGNAFEYCHNDLIIYYPCESRAQYYNDMQADIAYYHDKMYNCPAPPSNLHVTEIEPPASWSGKSTYLAVADMPGFEETDAELAKTWEAPTNCNSILIYHVAEQYGDDKMYYHYFNNGNFVESEEGWYDLGTVYSNANSGIKTFYTSSGGGSSNPEIKLNANFGGTYDWADTEAFTDNGDGTATLSNIALTAGYYYNFSVNVGDEWFSINHEFTRQNPSCVISNGEGIYYFQADVTGNYSFTWEYATNTLTIGYPEIHTYTAVGQNLAIFGNSWDPSITDNDMVLQEDGSYKWEKENVSFTGATTIQYRVCKDHAWDVAYPATSEQPASFEIPSLGDYKITITYNPVGNVISASAEKIDKPTIQLNGNFGGEWADTEAFEVVEQPMDSYAKLTKLLEPGTYEFGVKVNSEWRANGSAYTRDNYSYIIEEGHTSNLTIHVDVKGYYSFFWYYDNNRLIIDYSRVCGMYWKDVTAGNFEVTLGQEGEVTLPKVWATSMAFVSNIANGVDQVRLGSTDETVATIAYTLSEDGLGTLTFHQAGECDIYVVHDITNLYCYDSCAFHLTVHPAAPVVPVYTDADFAIDFRNDPYQVTSGSLPTGTEVEGSMNTGDPQHGYRLPVITIPVTAGNYKVMMGTCSYSNQDATIKTEDNSYTYATLETNNGTCYHNNTTANVVGAIFTVPTDQIIKVYGAEYTPFFSIEKMPEIPAFTDFELNFQTDPYNMISGAKPEGTVIAGSFHDDQHGYQNVEATVPVKAGKYRLTLGACEYDSNAGTVMSETNVELASFNQNLGAGKCYHNNTTKNIVSVIFDVDQDQTITIDCGQYTPYMKLEAVTSYAVEFALGDAEGTAPAAVDVTIGEDITMPVNKTLYKAGYTLTGWSDGVNTYPIGESFTPANDVVLTPVFTANEADLLNASTDVTVKWYFGGDNGAPVMHLEGSAGLLVAQATIGDKTVDVKLSIDATSGKFVPQPTTEWAQVRVGTIFTYPYKEGMTVDVHTYSGNVTYYVADGNVTCGTNDYYSFIEVTYPASAPTTAVVIGDPNDADQVTAFLTTYAGQTVPDLTIDRPVLNNMYNTLCLPFHMDADQIANSSLNGVEIYEFTGASVEGTTLNLSVGDPVNAVVAGRPYFVKYSAASQLDDLHFEDVTINNALLDNMAVTFDGVTFKGTFTPFEMPNGLNFQGGYLFLGQNNQLFWPNTPNPLKPFRAYFYVDVESSTPGNAPKYRGMPARIVEGKNVATGVENAQSANQSTKVIVNGQLIIIKNDVRYNAQGQIVK